MNSRVAVTRLHSNGGTPRKRTTALKAATLLALDIAANNMHYSESKLAR